MKLPFFVGLPPHRHSALRNSQSSFLKSTATLWLFRVAFYQITIEIEHTAFQSPFDSTPQKQWGDLCVRAKCQLDQASARLEIGPWKQMCFNLQCFTPNGGFVAGNKQASLVIGKHFPETTNIWCRRLILRQKSFLILISACTSRFPSSAFCELILQTTRKITSFVKVAATLLFTACP